MRPSKKKTGYSAQQRQQLMADFLVAFEKSLGVLQPAANMVGVHRKTIWEWRKKYPDFDDACKEVEDVAIDFVETQLYKLIRDGSEPSTIFYMKTKGRDRGYYERKELVGALNLTPPAVIIEGEDGDD